MRSNEKVKQFEEWLTEQKANGRLVPEQEPLIDAILSALPEETSSLAYLNHGNTISERLVDAIITFIKREIEIFGRPQDPVQSMSQGCNYYSTLPAASKSDRIEAWVKSMKAEGRLAPVQEARLKAIFGNLPEDTRLSEDLRRFVEFTPSLFTTLSKEDPEEETDQEFGEDSDEEIDFHIKLFQQSRSDQTDLMESMLIKDFEGRIKQAEQQNDLERAWVLDRCLGSFKAILVLKSAGDRRTLFASFAAFVDLDILLNKRHPDLNRLQAAQRILAEQIKRPIHRGRWSFIKENLGRRAKDAGRSRNVELQELAKDCLFEAIEVLVNVDFRSESSFDPQISADYKHIWGRLNDSLTELLAGPGWRERKSPRPRVLRKEGSRPVEVEITAEPRKETDSDDPDEIATLSSEERVAEKQTREAREKLEALMIEKLSLGAGKKPEYIEKLIATKKARRESALSLLMATFRAFTVMRSRN